jgi:hypothetical protein
VATSATCRDSLAHLLGSTSDDEYEYGGDGMAMPLMEVQRNVESLGGASAHPSITQGWIPAMPPGGSSSPVNGSSASAGRQAAGGRYMSHVLEELNAFQDHQGLSAPPGASTSSSRKGRSSASGKQTAATEGVMARVQSLSSQISATAAKAVAAGRPLASAVQQPISKAASQAATATGKAASATFAAMQDAMASKLPTASQLVAATDSYDEFPEEGAVAPMGLEFIQASSPGVLSSAAVRSLLKSRSSGAAGAAAAGVTSAGSVTPRSPVGKFPVLEEPASQWLVADDEAAGVRLLVIDAPAGLVKAGGRLMSSDLVTFESYSLGAKINAKLYQEASALYNRFMPLLLDYLEENPTGRVQLVGAGLGGALATVLGLMLVHRGLRHHALAPVYALNAPAVLCEVPDFKQWCSKEGCSLEDVSGMLEDMMTRGVLAELGLPQDAIRNVYYPAAAAASSVSPAGASPGAATVTLGGSVLRNAWNSAAIPEVLRSWIKGEGAAAGQGSGSSGSSNGMNATLQKLPTQILHPLGKVLVYTGLSK